jgi:hypothetical protein
MKTILLISIVLLFSCKKKEPQPEAAPVPAPLVEKKIAIKGVVSCTTRLIVNWGEGANPIDTFYYFKDESFSAARKLKVKQIVYSWDAPCKPYISEEINDKVIFQDSLPYSGTRTIIVQ